MKPKYLLIAIILVVSLLIGGIYFLTSWQQGEKPLQFLGENSYNLSLTTEDGVDLAATFYPSPLSVEDRGVILIHDSNRDRYQWVDFAQQLRDANFEVLIFDLRGHGMSEGDYTQFEDKAWRRMFMDVQAGTDYLHSLNSEMRIALVGAGSGAFTAMQVTKQSPEIAAVVMVEPPREWQGLKIGAYLEKFSQPIYLIGTDQTLLDKSKSPVKDYKKIEATPYNLADFYPDILNWLSTNLKQ